MLDLRREARSIFDAAVVAADPARSLRVQIAKTGFPQAKPDGKVYLIAFGKAALAMMGEALSHANQIGSTVEAIALTNYENQGHIPGVKLIHAGHPLPDENGLAASEKIRGMLAETRQVDQVIVLISGGGSALLPAPVSGISLEEKIQVNQVLLDAGLDIQAMNLVRQQLSTLKGGGLLRHAAPAAVTAFILSDVIGDDLRAIASGPTSTPLGLPADACALCDQHGLWDKLPGSVVTHLREARVDKPQPIQAACNYLIGSNRKSLDAAAIHADARFVVEIVSDHLTGDVQEAADFIVNRFRSAKGPGLQALLFGGETTVEIKGRGKGGRNQELALRVARAIDRLPERDQSDRSWCFLSGGTDGRDGPTDAAGGLVDSRTCTRIREAGSEPDQFLANNDSNQALKAAGDLLITGATGTNVADIQVLLMGL